MQNRFELPMMLSAKDLQTMGFKRSMAYRLLQGDLLPVVIIGKRRFIRHKTLLEWLADQEHTTGENAHEKSAAITVIEQPQDDITENTAAEMTEETSEDTAAAVTENTSYDTAAQEDTGLNVQDRELPEITEPTVMIRPVLPETKLTSAEFADPKNKKAIQERMMAVLEAQAPMLRDNLMKTIAASFGVSRVTSVNDAMEKAIKPLRTRISKQKELVYVWAPGQDPKTYGGIRICEDRPAEDICRQEIRNAAVYIMRQHPKLERDELAREIIKLMGYKRMSKTLDQSITAGLAFAKSTGTLNITKHGIVTIAE